MSTWLMLLQFAFCITLSFCGNELHIINERRPENQKHFTSSIDFFTNKDKGNNDFCNSLNATCVNKEICDKCRCDKDFIWLDYTQGCKGQQYLYNITNGERCFTHSTDASWVPTVQENISENTTLPLYVHDTSNLPNDIQNVSWSCQTDKVVWVYNGSIILKESFASDIKINNNGNKTLQFTNSTKLSMLSGMLLKLEISCTKGSQNVSTCFVFKVAGIKELEILTLPIKEPDDNDDDDDIMDIVKPVVIVGSIVLVLVGVFVYIMYKRRKYIKEQKERKISEAQAPLPGWMNHAARNAAKMSTVTILSEDVLYEQPNEISIKADALANHNKAFDEDEEDSISNKSTNDQNNKDNTTNHIHNNNNNGSIKKDDSPKIEDVELKESPKTNNISNGHVVTPLKDGSVDSPFDQLQETQISNDTVDSPLDHTEETLIPDDTVIHIPDNDDNDDNDSDSEIGEPIGNSTRQSDEDKDEDAKTMVHDISGSSLPSLSGSLVNDDFFGQMMNEYDRINTLPRK